MYYIFKGLDNVCLFCDRQDLGALYEFCKTNGINKFNEYVFCADTMIDIKAKFYKLIDSINKKGGQSLLVVKSVYSFIPGLKEMSIIHDLVKRKIIAIWCIDEHSLIINKGE